MRNIRQAQKKQAHDPVKEYEELKAQLEEAQETLRAIRRGEVDALVVSTNQGDRVFTLKGAETPYRIIVENISEGAVTLVADGIILYANAYFSLMLGVPLERVIGAYFNDFVCDEDRGCLPELFQTALREGAKREITLITADKRCLPVYLSIQRLPGDEKNQLSMVITDITERKRAEEALRRAHDELELRVQERTQDLTMANEYLQREIAERKRAEDELKRTVVEFERSNRELEQFAYVASHDLQEPLRTVSSYVDLLALRYKGKLDEKADTYISYAVEGASRMAGLINDLLAFSRVGTTGKSFARIEMKSVFTQVVENLKSAIRENEAVVTTDELPVVTGDDTQLVQLLQNLVGNAIKFRKKDEPLRIRISAQLRGNEWVFGVHDNGIGIEPRFFGRIFTIFQRLHTKEEYEGTGVGLAICRRIVERHRGRIWVESKPGEGSTFYFTLPATL